MAQKVREGQAAGKVARPEIGQLAQQDEQVLWQLVAQATTGWDNTVMEKITKGTLWRAVLSRQVLKNIYRVTDRDTVMQKGVTVEEVQDMQLAPVITPRLAVLVW